MRVSKVCMSQNSIVSIFSHLKHLYAIIRPDQQLVQNKCKHNTANIIQYQLVTELDDAQTLVMQPNKSNDLPH